jgi:hypothetical protein
MTIFLVRSSIFESTGKIVVKCRYLPWSVSVRFFFFGGGGDESDVLYQCHFLFFACMLAAIEHLFVIEFSCSYFVP